VKKDDSIHGKEETNQNKEITGKNQSNDSNGKKFVPV